MLATLLAVCALPSAGWAYTPEQQQACSNDAFRLCGPEIPDVDRVTVCMIRNKAQLSPGCRVYFTDGPEPVAAPAGTPMTIAPAHKPVAAKPHKAKKPAAKPAKPAKPAAT